jgi:uncharacterized membrane protein
MIRHLPAFAALLLCLAACTASDDAIDPEGKTFDAVAPDEVVILTGTKPFWSVRIADGAATWTTPDTPGGTTFAVSRFAGNNGLGFSGTLEGEAFTAALTPGKCSDEMNDRRYPYVATIALGGETLSGCGYTNMQPFTGKGAP